MARTRKICGEDCSARARIKDPRGRYFCKSCYEEARRRLAAKRAEQAPPADGTFALAEPDDAPAPPRPPETPAPAPGRCPSCDRPLAAGARICVGCGVNVETGRSIVTSRGLDENRIWANTEQIVRLVSWLCPIGFAPVASEAMGVRRPYTTWAVALLTVVVSVWFWLSTDRQMDTRKDLMLWAGNAPATIEQVLEYYEWTNWGDNEALEAKLRELERDQQDGKRRYETLIMTAHESLPPRARVIGRFHGYQLLTHALLHGDIFHLAGNLLFLLIFGSRVNAIVGNIGTAVLYPILAVLAALAHMLPSAAGPPQPMLGASGAIMGLAGLYFVLFPTNRMYMAAWFRWWFYFRMKIWTMRGFWVVLLYITFDAAYLALGAETGVAHWAHLGGFLAGGVLALVLLLARVLHAGGGDLVSVALGRHAWKLLGRPGDAERLGLRLPGVGAKG